MIWPSPSSRTPRLGLQLVHEAALCVTGARQQRVLSQRGLELACGLPFVASDTAMHELLASRTVEQAQRLQVALGRIRRASGDFAGRLLAIDPHRVRSYSQRQLRRWRDDPHESPHKVAATFFVLDADTHQPLCFTTASAARTATEAALELLPLADQILGSQSERPLVLADGEHLSAELFAQTLDQGVFDLLVPMASSQSLQKQLRALDPAAFTRRWAGFATARRPYEIQGQHAPGAARASLIQFLQRQGHPCLRRHDPGDLLQCPARRAAT